MAKSEESNTTQFAPILTIMLTTMLGMQLIRSLLPYLQPLLGERLGWSTIMVGIFALAVFLCTILAWPLNHFLGSGLLILICGFAVGLSRLAAQLWIGDPILAMIYSMVGVVAFILFLPTAVGISMRRGSQASAYLAMGFLAGLALDLALNGAFYTYDIIWQSGFWPTAISILLVAVQWWSIFRLLRIQDGRNVADTRFSQALAWTPIGPFIFLQLLIFSNIGWATTSSGWSFPAAFFWLLLAHIAGLAIWALPGRFTRWLLAVAWILTVAFQALLLLGQTNSLLVALYLLFGQVALAGTLVAAVMYLGKNATQEGLRNISIAGAIGMLLMVVLLFAYYAAYDLPLPFSNQVLPLTALLLVLLFSFAALRSFWRSQLELELRIVGSLAAVILAALLVPITLAFTADAPDENSPSSDSLRVMTYNLHYGANIKGQLDLEALAQVIEAQQPDIVGLQEVSRGWVINGSVDMLTWLANRLDMEPVFGPAADGQWGNAVLSKTPALESANYPLPTEDLLLRRAFIHSRHQAANGTIINLVNTHYHNPEDGGEVRVQQSETILDFVEGLPSTVIMGDMNAEHGMVEIDMFVESGQSDALEKAGVEPGFTNPVPDPFRRIDYIWLTPDWTVDSAVVPYSEASDHLPIVVTLTTGS